jgi:hypothetical protein
VVLQQLAITQLRAENEELKQQVAQATPAAEEAQKRMVELSNSITAKAAAAPDSQVRELARLRNEVVQLRGQTDELAKARQQIQALHERVAAEREAGRAQLADYQAHRQQITGQNACINNLRIIDSAKQQWALEQRKRAIDTPTWDDLKPYFGQGPNAEVPTCPDHGGYTINTVGEKPTCSVAGHELP